MSFCVYKISRDSRGQTQLSSGRTRPSTGILGRLSEASISLKRVWDFQWKNLLKRLSVGTSAIVRGTVTICLANVSLKDL